MHKNKQITAERISLDVQGCEVIATSCVLTAKDSRIQGDLNTVTGSALRVKGCNNRVNAANSVILGNSNLVFGNGNRVEGENCIVVGARNIVAGQGCRVVGDFCTVVGEEQSVRGSSCTLNGKQVLKMESPKAGEEDVLAKEGERSCVVCIQNVPVCVIAPCRHLCLCIGCAMEMYADSGPKGVCPTCRQGVESVFRIYHV